MPENTGEPLVNLIRIHRRKAGLSQGELGRVLGYHDENSVAKHERFESVPPFLIALGYEAIFQIPVTHLFPGLKQTVGIGIEARLAELEFTLRHKEAARIATVLSSQKLDWLTERKIFGANQPVHDYDQN
jgi:DNA-binding XRE family transcriptional regulator